MIQLSDLVTSLETSRRLVELGVNVETVFLHVRFHQSDDEPPIDSVIINSEWAQESSSIEHLAAALTAQELINWLFKSRFFVITDYGRYSDLLDEHREVSFVQLSKPDYWATLIIGLFENRIIELQGKEATQ